MRRDHLMMLLGKLPKRSGPKSVPTVIPHPRIPPRHLLGHCLLPLIYVRPTPSTSKQCVDDQPLQVRRRHDMKFVFGCVELEAFDIIYRKKKLYFKKQNVCEAHGLILEAQLLVDKKIRMVLTVRLCLCRRFNVNNIDTFFITRVLHITHI